MPTMTESKKVSGFDMGPAIIFHYQNITPVYRSLTPKIRLRTESTPNDKTDRLSLPLSCDVISDLMSLLPEAAVKRSSLRQYVGRPPTWFAKDCQVGNITFTENQEEALSPAAIIPSYVENVDSLNWPNLPDPRCDIHLFHINENKFLGLSPEVIKVIHLQRLCHELAHTIINREFFHKKNKTNLSFPNGSLQSVTDFVDEAAYIFGKYGPMSHYSSLYWKDGKVSDLLGVNEELCESIAAYLLGFVYCDDSKRLFDPFYKRPEVKGLVEKYLSAQRVVPDN